MVTIRCCSLFATSECKVSLGPAMIRDRITGSVHNQRSRKHRTIMYRKRSNSKPLNKLKARIEAAKSIEDDFDFGNGLNADDLTQFSDDLETSINGYNKTLSDADDHRVAIRDLERQANDISDRLLSLIGGSYGKDSLEYQRMGGTRKSEIQHTGSRPETYDTNGTEQDASEPDGSEV